MIWARPGNVIANLKRGNLVRDILTYIVSVLLFLILGFFKTSYWIIGVSLIGIYVVYVLLVYQEEKNKKSIIGGAGALDNSEILSESDTNEYLKDSLIQEDMNGLESKQAEEPTGNTLMVPSNPQQEEKRRKNSSVVHEI